MTQTMAQALRRAFASMLLALALLWPMNARAKKILRRKQKVSPYNMDQILVSLLRP